MKHDFRAAAIVLACVASAGQALAIGFRLPNHDSEAVARGNAFTATADNPAATLAQKAELLYASVTAVAARRILPNLSAAVGLTFNYSDVELQRAIALQPE